MDGPDQVATCISIMVRRFKFPVATGRLHHGARCYFGSLQAGPITIAMVGRPSTHCYYEYQALAPLRILESKVFRVKF
jgi:hypothetical protein